jgi:maleate cis-trans isomerase
MFEKFPPKLKIGMLKPLPVIDNSAYEYYRLAPRVMLVMVAVGLAKFSKEDVERVFAPIDAWSTSSWSAEVDLIMQSGVPLPLLLGVEGHDGLSTALPSAAASRPRRSLSSGWSPPPKRLGLRRIAVASKWSEPMIRTLGEFFARGGTEIVGFASEVLSPAQFQKIPIDDHMALAYELGRSALSRYPDADGLYIGGGSWLSEPVCQALEREFGKPAISNPSAAVWDTLTRLGHWAPIPGQGRLLSSA